MVCCGMTFAASPEITPREPVRRNGCLWGCLALLLIVSLPVILTAAYGTWFFYEGWRHNPVLRAAGEFVRQDGMARLALGNDIRITGIEGSAFSAVAGWGSRSDYAVELEGSKGEGTLDVTAETRDGRVKFQTMVLTGPDGARYDLMNHMAEPAPLPSGNSI